MNKNKTTKIESSTAKRGSPPDAVEFLKSQHREVEALFSALEYETSPGAKMRVFNEIADQLAMHATIEEMHFYPAVRDKRTEDILVESLEEHQEIKNSIADLLRLKTTDDEFDSKIQVLQEQVENHVAAEEDDLFPKVKRIFNQDDMLLIAAAMQKKYTEMVGTNYRDQVIVETQEAAPL